MFLESGVLAEGRAVRQAVEKAHLEGHQAACEEFHCRTSGPELVK